ncbi:ATP-dependent helicase [Streptomyces ficellus]|uniref:ATP-dependent helicase n=1 Tax=Streptomyces ficellus TaxID=1977088 RepID=A0ABT7Z2I7_9ACTN|nr:ATP-dependent helicase [Streptomyces ficellus]MDN3293718.1 ATP-dependent helicase [Streptomyces ficellus]
MTTGPYDGTPALTGEQLVVIEQSAEAKVLVTAGAGAGKTHTLVRRVEALITDHGLTTGDILILTFSNAAVRELRERLSRHQGRSRHVRVTTFDSWALEILSEVAADIDWRTCPFDERIREATQRIQDESTAPEWLDELRHLVIDEVQDLVGDRRELVEVLLEAYDCGFTVVGDPAQAIYGFQVIEDDQRAIETNRFFDWLRSYFAGELVELSLTRNFRARTAEARSAQRFEKAVRECTTLAVADRVHEDLRAELATLMSFGDITVPFIRDSLGDTSVSTAVLCRTNGEALLISEWLHTEGIDHQLRRAAQDRTAPAWLNELMLVGNSAPALTRQRFGELHPLLVEATADTDPERLWRLLLSCAGDRAGRSIDLSRLRDAIALHRLPDALTAQPPHPLVISTFHRAKGLEFDRVLLVDPGPVEGDENLLGVDVADRARALYVAMTRARDEAYRLDLPEAVRIVDRSGLRLVRRDRRSGRWARFGYQRWKRLGIELMAGDIHTHHPAGRHGFEDDARSLQTYLRSHVAAGDEVELVRIDGIPEDHHIHVAPGYALAHRERLIGVASESFRRDMYRLMQQSHRYEPRNWPRRITGLRLDTVETVAGEGAAGSRAGLGDLGVWLAPRPTGLGRFHYDFTDKD